MHRGVDRLVYWARLDSRFIGGVAVTFAWVLPEYLIAVNALNAPSLSPYPPGLAFLSVGAIMGSAAANLLVVGVLGFPKSAKAESEGRELGSAAALLLVTVLAVVGTVVLAVVNHGQGRAGREPAMTMGRIVAGCVVFGVLFACQRLVNRSAPKEQAVEPELLFHQGRGSLIGSLGLTAASVVVLAYATVPFVERAAPWFRFDDDLPRSQMALSLGGLTIALGLFMAVPDLILSVRNPNGGDVPRLLSSSAALTAFTIFAPTPSYTFASSLFGSFTLTVFVVALTLILLLALPAGLSARPRRLVLLGVTSAGFAFALLMTGH